MSNPIIQILKRFSAFKSLLGNQIEIGSNVGAIVGHKLPVIIMTEENRSDMNIIHSKTDSLTWLHKAAPGFPVNGSKIRIIHEPNDFYSTLVEKCKNATRRIIFASLYLGSGKLESELIKAIEESVNLREGNIKVRILLDYMRGSRGKENSRKMLEPLVGGKFGQYCKVFLYHTPHLRGFLKTIIPDRFNELIGLQHMKIYMVDDCLIISGANLSNDYFTNRQDRYFVIEDCTQLCDFYENLVEKVGEFSFLLQSGNKTVMNPATKYHPVEDAKKQFIGEAANKIHNLFQSEMNKCERNELSTDTDTWIFPLIEMGQLNIHHDSKVTLKLLETVVPNSTLRLATGYFNLTSEYANALLNSCKATCHLLTAHPTANGFFGAKGIARGIPAAYTKMEQTFFKKCEKYHQQDRIVLWEFCKPGWTYHAKGLWYSLPGDKRPCLTLIGSPNFGYRSVKRDLETQVAIMTDNSNLREQLQQEYQHLFSNAQSVTRNTLTSNDRIVPVWVRAIVIVFRYFF